MPLQPINYGAAANDGTGDSLREAMRKSQANFVYLDQGKVDKVAGMGLSSNNYTNAERVKLVNIGDGASNDRSKHTGTQTLDTISDAGTAASHDVQTSAVDATSGAVLTAGAFGIGIPMSIAGADAAMEPGTYSVSPGPGWPWSNGGSLRVEAIAGSIFRTQFATPFEDMVYVRHGNTSGAWQAWTDVRERSNHKGTQAISTVAGLSDALNAISQAADSAHNRANHIGSLNWAWSTYGGTANAISLTPAFARASYVIGDQFRFRATASNTGATTINVGGLGAKSAVTVTGAALPAGYIRTDVDTVCVYDGTQFVVQREIETGTNSNGTYTKFADGTLICSFTKLLNVSVPAGAGYSPPLDFAATFVSTEYIHIQGVYYTGAGATGNQLYGLSYCYEGGGKALPSILNTGTTPSTSHPGFTIGPNGASSVRVSAFAKGKWK